MPQRSVSAFQPTGIAIGTRFYSDDAVDAIVQAAGGLPDGKVAHKRPSDDEMERVRQARTLEDLHAIAGELEGEKDIRPVIRKLRARRKTWQDLEALKRELLNYWDKEWNANDDKDGFVTVHVDRRTALAERLETAAKVWDVHSQWQVKPTAKQRADAFEEIENAADRLLGVMRLPVQSDESDVLGPMPNAVRFDGLQAFAAEEAERLGGFPQHSGEGLLEGYVSGVYRLRDWARAARKRCASRRATPRDKRHIGDAALDALFGNLVHIWIDIFKGHIGTSVGAPDRANEGKAGGPLVRFIEACLQPLLGTGTPSAAGIRKHIRQLSTPRKSTRKKT